MPLRSGTPDSARRRRGARVLGRQWRGGLVQAAPTLKHRARAAARRGSDQRATQLGRRTAREQPELNANAADGHAAVRGEQAREGREQGGEATLTR